MPSAQRPSPPETLAERLSRARARDRRRPGRRLILAIAGALVLGLLVAWVLFSTVLWLPGGPLAGQGGNGVGHNNVRVGQPVTLTHLSLGNPTDRTITIESITLAGPEKPGLELLGVLLAPTGKPIDDRDLRWPPKLAYPGAARRPEGYELGGRNGGADGYAMVLFGLRLRQPGAHSYEGFTVRYRDRGLNRTVEIPWRVGLGTGDVSLPSG